ncbi:unnamed protein product [marine sediment metagenome]|uniref:Uncharacterized protein n=1 Tax=marine sediment metagenome TaxID=412755 RepID=X1QX14_9ZZZZ
MPRYEIRLIGSVLAEFEDCPTEEQITEYLSEYTAQQLLDVLEVEEVVDA